MKQFLSGTFYNLINGLKKSNYKRKFGTGKGRIGSLSCWILLMLLGITGCGKREAVIQNVNTAMGTIFQQTLYVEDTNQNVGADILKLVEELENSLLSWRVEGAELSKINGQAGNAQGAVLSERLEGILTECFQVSRASEGAFDVTILPVSRLWNMDEQAGKETGFVVPTKEQVAEALQNTGY
ncbi:MAG: FAD:protein FMN transferase, partial [Lachnospiraceae bacterium]|nr:FAD:protein FMN transferase [Lachnospiraceae bacterium]